jgi:ATP-dependent protease ClpP protease subunit
VAGTSVSKPSGGNVGKPQNKARPGALPVPANRDVHAFTTPDVMDKWAEDAAGVRAVATGDNIITMFEAIGEDYWTGGGVTAKRIASQLRAIGERPIEVQINSPGGDVFEGIAIYNVLREHPQPITVKVMGMAASAASIIAMAGDNILIGAASFIMIHNTWVVSAGNRHDMREVADWLEPFDQALVDVYASRTGQDPKAIAKWMDEETFMSGSLAITRRFADELLASDAMTVDDSTKAEDRKINELRAMELTLVSAGKSRTEARASINKIKGTPGAASEDSTPGAAVDDYSGLAGLLATLQN